MSKEGSIARGKKYVTRMEAGRPLPMQVKEDHPDVLAYKESTNTTAQNKADSKEKKTVK